MAGIGTVTHNAAWLMGQRLVMGVFSVLVVAVVARYLGTEEYGHLVLLLSYNALLSQLASLGLRPYSVREMAARRSQLPSLLAEMLSLRMALAFGVGGLAVPLLHWLDPLLPDPLLLVLALQLVTNALAMVYLDGLYGLEAIKDVAKVLGTSGTAVQLASLAAVGLDAGLMGVAWAYVVGSLVTIAMGWSLVRAQAGAIGPGRLRRASFRHVIDSRVFFFQNIVHTIRQRLDIVIITSLAGAHAAGVYGASLTLVQRLDTIQDALATALFPRVSSLQSGDREELRELVRQIYKLVLVIALPLGVGLFGTAGSVVPLVFGRKFLDAGPVLATLALAIPFSFAYGMLYNVLGAMGRQDTVFRCALWALVPGLAGMAFAVHLAGPLGAAVAFVAIVAVLAVTLGWVYTRDVGRLASAGDYARLAGANAAMGLLLAFGSGLHLAILVPACAGLYGLAVLAFRVISPATVRSLLRRRKADGPAVAPPREGGDA